MYVRTHFIYRSQSSYFRLTDVKANNMKIVTFNIHQNNAFFI